MTIRQTTLAAAFALAAIGPTQAEGLVSARNDSEQAGIGWCLVIGVLDQHSHFATDALQAHRHRQGPRPGAALS